jgi:hypothetical protein
VKDNTMMHTIYYPISQIGIHIPIIGKPIFMGQCNWTGNYHEITVDQFYKTLVGSGDEVHKLSFTDNIGMIDPITQTVTIRYDLMNTPPSDQAMMDACIANLLIKRLTEMKVLPAAESQGEQHDGDDNDPFN